MSSFMQKYKKDMSKKDGMSIELLDPPRYYLHSGSYSLNKLMSGSFEGAIPQGRLVSFAGHSSSGKSLVGVSVLGEAQKAGGYAVAIDSEGSLDNNYLRAAGVDPDAGSFLRVATSRINRCSSAVTNFIQEYKDSGETVPVVILVDSLDMLFTDSEQKAIDTKGELGGDQGQRAKQLKRMLMSWVHSISNLPITIICSKQVYQEQDPIKAYEEPWVYTEALKYVFSQIIIVEKLQFKDKTTKEHKGFIMKARTYKSRLSPEKQVVRIEVPFGNGLDPYAGLLEIAEEYGVVEKNGGWFTPATFEGDKFQKKAAERNIEFMDKLLEEIRKVDTADREVHANLDEYVAESDDSTLDDVESSLARRRRKAKKGFEDDES